MILKWTTEEDGYSVAERLLEGVIFQIDVELNLEKVKELKSFSFSHLYNITAVRPKSPGDRSYLLHIGGGEATVTHWCDKIKEHAIYNEAELMTDEIFNLPEVQELWNKYHE